MQSFCEINNIINSKQFGFCKASGTLSATSYFVDVIHESLDKKLFVGAIFIDLTKAFDSVVHYILLNKLENVGIGKSDLNLLISYLSQREQFVNISENVSRTLQVKYGVPQGSLLGPLLFILYVNDAFHLDLSSDLIMYADDMVLITSAQSYNELQVKMQNDLCQINSWASSNNLKLNKTKTKFMIFETRNKLQQNFILHINDYLISKIDSIRYLGSHIDSKLNWSSHITHIRNKLRYINFLLHKTSNFLPVKVKYLIYHSHFVSHIRYLLPIWGAATSNELYDLQILMNRALKNVKNLPYRFSTAKLYDKTIIPIDKMYRFELILFIYKIKNNHIKPTFNLVPVNLRHEYETRRKSNLQVKFCRTTRGQTNLMYQDLVQFNALPREIKHTPEISVFKKKLKEFLSQ